MRKEPALTLADMSAATGVCVAAVWKLLAHLIEKEACRNEARKMVVGECL